VAQPEAILGEEKGSTTMTWLLENCRGLGMLMRRYARKGGKARNSPPPNSFETTSERNYQPPPARPVALPASPHGSHRLHPKLVRGNGVTAYLEEFFRKLGVPFANGPKNRSPPQGAV